MRRNVLPTAMLVALTTHLVAVSAAHAVFLNPGGAGQALIYPYYTVNGGNSTVITVVNTSDKGKAVKVRFREAYDGRDVLDFNLYLSPTDVWTGQVIPSAGGAGLLTGDNSCTVPTLSKVPLAFSTRAFDGSGEQGKDGGPITIDRTLEGYIELIEMGTVTNATRNSLDAITHSNGTPLACKQVVAAWASGGYWTANPSVDMGPPSGGLIGTGTLINVALGTVEGYVADVLDQFYSDGSANTHSAPDALTPNLASGTSLTSLAYANDAPVSSTFARSIDAVSSVFMVDTINNEYWTGSGISAASEWVVTFPTKPFYTDPYFVGATAQMPFDVPFSNAAAGASSCSPVAWQSYDREEAMDHTGFEGLPNRSLYSCYGAEVFTFNEPTTTPGVASAVLASKLGEDVVVPANNGWANLYLSSSAAEHHLPASSEGHIFIGQPATGFWIVQFVNGNVGGILANYTAPRRHKSTSSCTIGTPPQPCS